MNNKLLGLLSLFTVLAFLSCSNTNDLDSGNSSNGKTTAVFNSSLTYGTMKDQDGNVYKTITIGSQIWMAENLRTTKYNDGTAIPNVTDANKWGKLITGAFCSYNNTSNVDSIATYGRLYNWYAVNTGLLAPKGWHVPTDNEWIVLTNYLGGEGTSGGKLKEKGILHWKSNNSATNSFGFTALPGGYRYDDGHFDQMGDYGTWWSVSLRTNYTIRTRCMYSDINSIYQDYHNNPDGVSVRCIKD